MHQRLVMWFGILVVAVGASCRQAPAPPTAAPAVTAKGTIRGHVRLTGTPPPNAPIRMQADPMCDRAHAGQPAFEETVVAGPDGSLANVFVQLEGTFPPTPPPTEPVTIDQHGCVYVPRVVGVRVGQPLRVMNSDPGLHNVHGLSEGRDGFNIGQPMAGMVNEVKLKDEGILRLKCDVHTWMQAYVGVVNHPYFAVTDTTGTFELHDVPVGTYSIRAWHERYGPLTSSVQVTEGGVTSVDFSYTGEEKPDGLESSSLDDSGGITRIPAASGVSPGTGN
jgi:plastocyanin